MNREEINQALKLLKEPITVNCIEYKYFDQENYEKLLSVYENCRWFVDNYEQILQNIEKLQQELQRKDNIINELKEYIGRFLYMLNGILDRDIYEQCQLDDFTQIMDKIKELEERK